MVFDQHENTLTGRVLPVFPQGRLVLVMLVFFLLCAGIGIVSPVTALDPDNQTLVDNLVNKGDICWGKGDYYCSLAAYESAHQIDPGNADILLWWGETLSDVGNNSGALEKMDAALALAPEDAEIWYEKGKVLDNLGRFTESGPCYDRAEELDPRYRVPLTKHFPLNVLIHNATIIIVACGFFLLGIYIYFDERRR